MSPADVRRGPSARSKARKRAVDILFEAESRGLDLSATLADRVEDAAPALNPYTVTLVEGVAAHRPLIDRLLSRHSTGWTLDRMPAVDRTVLRVGVFELLFVEGLPKAVALSEAVALVTDLSTDESPAFVNGLLAAVATDPDPFAEPEPEPEPDPEVESGAEQASEPEPEPAAAPDHAPVTIFPPQA